jgi:hemerythrin-like domain-containing protein
MRIVNLIYFAPRYIDHLNAGWMIPAVGPLVAAAAAPIIDADYVDVGWLGYGFGILFLIPLFTLTFYRTIFKPRPADGMVLALWIWVAGFAVAAISYVSLKSQECASSITCTDNPWQISDLPRLFFFASVTCFFILGLLTFRRYFGRQRFEMSYWNITFPLETFAVVLIQYYQYIHNDFIKILAILAIVLANWVVLTVTIHTVVAMMERAVFSPHPAAKFGPMAFMKMTHYAFRVAARNLKRYSAWVDSDNPASLTRFVNQFKKIEIMHEEHSQHEDFIIYPAMAAYHPGIQKQAHMEHDRDHYAFYLMNKLIQRLQDGPDTDTALQLKEELDVAVDQFCKDLVNHLDYEESQLNPGALKNFSHREQKSITRRIWAHTPSERWAVIVPFIMNNQDIHMRRVMFLRALVWAMPEKAQQIGWMVWRGVPSTTWERIVRFVPEIIPRHLWAWHKIF